MQMLHKRRELSKASMYRITGRVEVLEAKPETYGKSDIVKGAKLLKKLNKATKPKNKAKTTNKRQAKHGKIK